MDHALDIATAAILALGVFVGLVSAVGVLRMPDFYTRLHPAGKNDSLGQLLVLGALLLQAPSLQVGLKLFLIAVFLLLTTPASTYAIARAARNDGKVPWAKPPPPPAAPGEVPAKPKPEAAPGAPPQAAGGSA